MTKYASAAIALFSLMGVTTDIAAATEQEASDRAPRAIALEVTVTGIKKPSGVIRLALCPQRAEFPECGARAVRTATMRIERGQAHVVLTGLAPGTYAVSAFHDANENGKLDTLAGIPREGYGFSNNPSFKPRAPRFAECEIVLTNSAQANIRLRYLL